LLEKICLLDLKTAAGKLKNWGAGKDSPEVARNKMIQRTLGVKVDGIMGTMAQQAEATWKILWFTLESKLRIMPLGCLLRLWLKKPATTDRSMDPIKLLVQSNLGKMRQEKRAYRKHKESTKPQ
jgi:hypothetical protein